MLWLRKIVFYIFAFVYLILCPLIVARMLGFVINPLTHRLGPTGLVYVSTNPPDATVYIDGRLGPQKTPTVIRDLTPEEHFIRIELGGYNDWEGNIPIVGKKATILANILLIPEAWPVKKISTKPYQDITFVGAQKKFLINDNTDLVIKQGEWIRLYTKEGFGGSQVYDVARSKPGTNIYFEEKNGELFYLDDGGFLSVVQILPYRPVLNIPIPDALRISHSRESGSSYRTLGPHTGHSQELAGARNPEKWIPDEQL